MNGNKRLLNCVGQERVTVPNRLWKGIVVLPVGSNDVNRVTSSTRVVTVNTPNGIVLSSDWGSYRTSVDLIEQATGLDLLSALPSSVQNAIETRVDSGPTQ